MKTETEVVGEATDSPLPSIEPPVIEVTSAAPVVEHVLKMQNVTKQFGKNEPVVKDLSFEVARGQIFCLLGPSGSGKSTTMRILTGTYQPTEGKSTVFGVVSHRMNQTLRERLSYMPQQFVLFPELSVYQNINFMASVYGMSWFSRRPYIREALELVELWDARRKLASQLSGGMRRRLALACALVHQPELIFMDEPTAGIDPVLRARFWEHFEAMRDKGLTIFVTTQYVTEADYCDMVAILNQGRLLALGTPEEIRQQVTGGEIIDLTLNEVTRPIVQILREVPGVLKTKRVSDESIRLTVTNSGESLPQIVSALQQNEVEIVSITPYRPTFDEIFVQLMEQDPVEAKS